MKPKFKLKLNVFDIIIIVLALVLGYAALRMWGADGGAQVLSSGAPATVTYTLEISDMPAGLAAMIKPGDSLSEAVEKRFIGTVVEASYGPYMRTSENNETGDWDLVEVPGRETATLTVSLGVSDTGAELDASGFILRANTSPSVLGPGYAGLGLITSIQR